MVTFSVVTRDHPEFGWVMVPLFVAQIQLRMMLNTGSPRSVISEAARDTLIQNELLPPQQLAGYTLTPVALAGQRISDLPVRVRGPVFARAHVDGMLGLDFLRQFTEIHFDVAAFRLTLTLP